MRRGTTHRGTWPCIGDNELILAFDLLDALAGNGGGHAGGHRWGGDGPRPPSPSSYPSPKPPDRGLELPQERQRGGACSQLYYAIQHR